MDVSLIVLITGLLILVGFAGRLLQQRVRIPESLSLIVFGVLLGPVLGLVPAQAMMPFVPLISTLALIGILLETGLEFEAGKLGRDAGAAVGLTVLVGALTTLSVGGFLHLVMGWDLLVALLIGVISSGTTTLTTQVLLRNTDAPAHVKRVLLLESVLNDLTIVVAVIAIMELMTHAGASGLELVQTIAAQFSVALVIGALGGWAWKSVAEQTGAITRLGYISTLGACLVLYFITEAAGGSPVLSVFSFGLVIGNHERIHRHLHAGQLNLFGTTLQNIKQVQGSFTFFMRSFFFFALGTVFSTQMLQGGVLAVCAGIVALVLAARALALWLLSAADPGLAAYRNIMTVMIPRGFVATVVSFLPAQRGIDIPQLPEIVLLTVMATTLVAMGGAYVFRQSGASQKAAGGKGGGNGRKSAKKRRREKARGAGAGRRPVAGRPWAHWF